MQHPLLWERIVGYEFPRGFNQKLCQQLGCRAEIGAKLQDEYRRFIYLAMISPCEATPSEQVDRVWHLHLTYTRDYWKKFCPDVLQREFHHDPCDGPESQPRYDAQYETTLALYQQEFESDPPSKSWPTQDTWKSVQTGWTMATVGFILAFLTIFFDWSNTVPTFWLALPLMVGGVFFATSRAPYDSRTGGSRTGSEGGGGGGAGGCGASGGGGCGGG
jgi:hypothetical protein